VIKKNLKMEDVVARDCRARVEKFFREGVNALTFGLLDVAWFSTAIVRKPLKSRSFPVFLNGSLLATPMVQ
jgi:hypothetical protein